MPHVEQGWNRHFVVQRPQVRHRGLPVRRFQLAPDTDPAELHGRIHLRTDAHERREHRLARVRPEMNDTLDEAQLERADVSFVVGLALRTGSGVRLADVVPDRVRPRHPCRVVDIGRIGTALSPGLRKNSR